MNTMKPEKDYADVYIKAYKKLTRRVKKKKAQ